MGEGDPGTSRGLVREGDAVSQYWFIHAHRASYSITMLCRLPDVARSGYYAWLLRGVDWAMAGHLVVPCRRPH